jgi:hypothetical protein
MITWHVMVKKNISKNNAVDEYYKIHGHSWTISNNKTRMLTPLEEHKNQASHTVIRCKYDPKKGQEKPYLK